MSSFSPDLILAALAHADLVRPRVENAAELHLCVLAKELREVRERLATAEWERDEARADNAALRAALEVISTQSAVHLGSMCSQCAVNITQARAALTGKEATT